MSILAAELDWPVGTKFFEVRCRLGIWDVDGWDLDKAPEVKTLGGTVRITPRTPTGRIRILEPDGKYRVVVTPPLTFAIDEFTGKLVNTADNTEGVWVVNPSSDTIDPKGFTYSAVVTPKVGSPFTVEFDGTVAINGVYDLANGTTVAPSRGVSVLESRITKLEQETSGGFYINESGQKVDYVMVASDTDPGKTKTIDGKTYEVWWIQTNPPDPSKWVPAIPSFDLKGESYTIPTDDGATYTVHGVATSAGTYYVIPPETVAVNAIPKPGYTFAEGASSSWTQKYELQPIAYDVAVSNIQGGVEYYYRLDEPETHNGQAPVNRGQSTLVPFGSPIYRTYGGESLGVGVRSLIPPGSGEPTTVGRWWLNEVDSRDGFTFACVLLMGAIPPASGASSMARRYSMLTDWSNRVLFEVKDKLVVVDGAWVLPETPELEFRVISQNATMPMVAPGPHHIAMTQSGNTGKFFMDGELVWSGEVVRPPKTATLKMFQGAIQGIPAHTRIAGLVIDRTKAISDAEVKALADAVGK